MTEIMLGAPLCLAPLPRAAERRDVKGGETVIQLEMSSSEPSSADASPPSPDERTPAAGEAAFVRFRDRVRSREGNADLLTFRIGTERFGFDIRAVDEVLDGVSLHAIPEAPPALVGVTTFRGRTLAVFEPGAFLGTAHDVGGTVLVMRSGDRRIGLLVDDVDDVESLELASLSDPPFDLGDELLLGVVWREGTLTSIIDARALVGACHVVAAGGGKAA